MSSQIQKGENYILENADLLIEEYYSVEQKKFYLGIYESTAVQRKILRHDLN